MKNLLPQKQINLRQPPKKGGEDKRLQSKENKNEETKNETQNRDLFPGTCTLNIKFSVTEYGGVFS